MKLSPTQLKMLENVRDGLSYDAHRRGRSAHGGANGTLASLINAKLLIKGYPMYVITARGRIELHLRNL